MYRTNRRDYLNFAIKSHRGRSPSNKTDAICIVEFNGHISRVYARTIPDKRAETLYSHIEAQVEANSIIWTDEHRSYSCLKEKGFLHETVCHKYQFVTVEGVNTQAVESFNNILKIEIKKRKGVLTEKREDLLKEVCFYFNNKNRFLEAILDLLKL